MGLRHIISHPDQWIALLPVKFFHLWASDRYDMGLGIFPEGFRVIVPALWVIAQAYWTVIVIGATMAAVSRPILGYWLKFPAILASTDSAVLDGFPRYVFRVGKVPYPGDSGGCHNSGASAGPGSGLAGMAACEVA